MCQGLSEPGDELMLGIVLFLTEVASLTLVSNCPYRLLKIPLHTIKYYLEVDRVIYTYVILQSFPWITQTKVSVMVIAHNISLGFF